MNRKVIILILIAVAVIASIVFIQAGNKKVVAIATFATHPALDAVQEGIKKELASQGYIEGKNIRYVIRNANGQIQLATNIASDLVSQKPDVIVAITTGIAQAIAKASSGPLVFAAVTDPVGAGLVKSIEKGEPLITGTSDAWPYEDQLKLIHEISPAAKKIGVLYNPGEVASQYGIKQIRSFAKALGFELLEGAVSSTNDVYPVAQNLASQTDALFLSSDATVISGVAAAARVAIKHKIPLYVGDSGTVENGGLAAASVGYGELGRETGKLVAKTLKGEKNIPTVVARGSDVFINKRAAQLMGVTLPELVLKKATKVYEEIHE